MKTEFVNPFINAIDKALETMAGINADRKKPFIKKERSTRGDITGIIGFAEKNISGSVALSFPLKTILIIYETMMGTPATELNDEVERTVYIYFFNSSCRTSEHCPLDPVSQVGKDQITGG